MPSKSQSITSSQQKTLRAMLNTLAYRPYDDNSIETEIATLSKKQGVMLICVVGHILKTRSAFKSSTTMMSLQPLFNNLGISVSLTVH